jgi:hypothetical protein
MNTVNETSAGREPDDYGPGVRAALDSARIEQPSAGQQHLNWCVERAMQYAHTGDMTNAWASFASDVRKHEGTEHIATHELFAMAMFSGLYDRPDQFREFISGWAVRA